MDMPSLLKRARGWFAQRQDVLDPVSGEEIGNAVRLLYGTRHARRKRQRKRMHVTYKQRDAIAWLLIRLQQERTREDATMQRAEWVSQFCQYMAGLSDYADQDIADAAELEADDQRDRTGSDNPSLWQAPAAAAQKVLTEWNADDMEAADVPEPGDDHQLTPEPPGDPEAAEPAPGDAPATELPKAYWQEPDK